MEHPAEGEGAPPVRRAGPGEREVGIGVGVDGNLGELGAEGLHPVVVGPGPGDQAPKPSRTGDRRRLTTTRVISRPM